METPIITKEVFNYMFERWVFTTNPIRIFTANPIKCYDFNNIVLKENKIIFLYRLNYGRAISKFDCLIDLGFSRIDKGDFSLLFELQIASEYIDSVKNLFDLALSDIEENRELAYQLFQNIKEYSTNPNNNGNHNEI